MISCTSAAFARAAAMYCNSAIQRLGFSEVNIGVYSNSKTTVVSTAVSGTAALIAVSDTVDV